MWGEGKALIYYNEIIKLSVRNRQYNTKNENEMKMKYFSHSSAADPLLASISRASIVRARSRARARRTSTAQSSSFRIPEGVLGDNEENKNKTEKEKIKRIRKTGNKYRNEKENDEEE